MGGITARIDSKVVGLAAFLLAAWVVLAHAGTKPQTLTPGLLRIGTYFVNPPFEFISKGKRVGFEHDLMDEVARRLRLRAVFDNTRWETILQQMREGQYDCIIGGITITPARQRILLWSAPYLTTTLSLVVNSQKTPQIHDLAGLKDATVAVQAATTDYDAAVAMQRRGEIKAVKVYPFAEIADAITDLSAGRITAVMKVKPVAVWLARYTSDLRIIAEVPGDPQPLGFGIDKDNAALLTAVNEALTAIKQDGTYARLAGKWGIS